MSREVLDSRSSYDELYDDRPERDRGPRPARHPRLPTWWSTKVRSVLPVATAFVVGLVLGGVGWNEWQVQRAAAAASSTVSFTAEVASADATRSGIDTYVRLTNNGPEPVIVDELELTDTAVRSSSRRGTGSIDVQPDRKAIVRLSLDVDCSVRTSVQPSLSMRVRTADGATRSPQLPLEDDDDWLDAAMSMLCPDPNDTFIPLAIESNGVNSIMDEGGPVLRMPLTVGLWTPLDVTVLSMRPVSNRLSVAVEGLPLEIAGEQEDRTTLLATTWRVVDCRDAESLRYEALGLVIEAQRPGGIVITTRVQSEPNMALELAKFVGDVCRST
jgi:hypothetical protein